MTMRQYLILFRQVDVWLNRGWTGTAFSVRLSEVFSARTVSCRYLILKPRFRITN
jgi:hypothetical protein